MGEATEKWGPKIFSGLFVLLPPALCLSLLENTLLVGDHSISWRYMMERFLSRNAIDKVVDSHMR